jgi:hypothetical protein
VKGSNTFFYFWKLEEAFIHDFEAAAKQKLGVELRLQAIFLHLGRDFWFFLRSKAPCVSSVGELQVSCSLSHCSSSKELWVPCSSTTVLHPELIHVLLASLPTRLPYYFEKSLTDSHFLSAVPFQVAFINFVAPETT